MQPLQAGILKRQNIQNTFHYLFTLVLIADQLLNAIDVDKFD